MERNELIVLMEKLGRILSDLGNSKVYSGYEYGLSESEYEEFENLIERVHIYNPWFTPLFVRKSLLGIASWLTEEKLSTWLNDYTYTSKPKRVGLIMAGNIPLVGFHDFLCVLMSGNIAVCKFSSNDNKLWPAVLNVISTIDQRISTRYEVKEYKLGEIDAIIATGSDNSSRYFEFYFSKYPHIIRKNRTSVAVIDGTESSEDFEKLGDDIFNYFGLGCRNVSQLLVPESFNFDLFFNGIYKYNEIIMNHHKYINNFDYNRAIYLLNQEDVLENGFALLRFTDDLLSPLSVINCLRYKNKAEIGEFIEKNKEKIQVVIGKEYLPFGDAQTPSLVDYADNIDTMRFLNSLN